MADFDHTLLDDIIHSRIRLAIMAVLVAVEQAEFTFLKEKVNATDGNLSVHLKKLDEAGYVSAHKRFVGRKPLSSYRLTARGRRAFELYVERLEELIRT
ncbi:MAG: transcriptional regulator [Candidatus Edwardsbacteria bacterium]|jgi:DNA-binding transcriptional ArsR family regulator|nr:transcriptional regulator [Candidatus Edwardsbacteria bacterium]